MDPATGLLLANLGAGLFGGIAGGSQAAADRRERAKSREDENRRWQAADPLRQQLMQMVMGRAGQPAARFQGPDFFSPKPTTPPGPQGPPQPADDEQARIRAFLMSRFGRGPVGP